MSSGIVSTTAAMTKASPAVTRIVRHGSDRRARTPAALGWR